MNEFQKSELVSGSLPLKSFSMEAPHLTSNNFMELRPIVAVELIPDTTGDITVHSHSEPLPITKPFLGQTDINNRFFWVRYPSVWRPFYEFKADTPYVRDAGASISSIVPHISLEELSEALCLYVVSGSTPSEIKLTSKDSATVAAAFDPEDPDGANARLHEIHVLWPNTDSDSATYPYVLLSYQLSSKGRYLLSVLKALGYDVVFVDHTVDEDIWEPVSLLPLLCFVKVVLDWYFPSQYVNIDSTYIAAVRLLMREYSYQLNAVSVLPLLDVIVRASYNDDYFTSAWDNPVSPANGAFSTYSLLDITLQDTSVANIEPTVMVSNNPSSDPGTSVIASGNVGNISQYSIDMLGALSRFMRRHQIAGARALDRWLADFGLSIRADKLNRSIYLGSDKGFIQFGKNQATAASYTSHGVGNVLGDYSGKGDGTVVGKKHEFSSAEDFGMLICVSSHIPSGGIVQGIRRHILHLHRLDFHDGEFDGKGVQAISRSELLNREYVTPEIQGVFGFAPRYAEYKILRPQLSGDFISNHVNVGLDCWHGFRMFDGYDGSLSPLAIGPSFIEGDDAEQFNRMFSVTDASIGDAFKTLHWIKIEFRAPMVQLSDDYLFHDSVGKKVTLQSNGTKLN